jgi:3-phosphoshikimate 1-carboxyvinyltransferase
MMATVRIGPPAGPLAGTLAVPGDKSIAHRALLLGALADGTTTVSGFPGGADVLSTLGAIRALGARAERDGALVRIEGAGSGLGHAGETRIDCGNSGTTMRLGAGMIAGGPGTVILDGDASLRRRPMERVAEPLRAMGADITTVDGHAPVTVRGTRLSGIDWHLRVASAQVKSAILLAGLRASGTTRVHEVLASRDHTERLLAYFGARLRIAAGRIEVEGGQRLRAADVPLPGDVSSAAFLIVAALLVPGSELVVHDVGVNPTRTGALTILRRMGARIEVIEARDAAGEPRADIRARASALHGTAIEAEEVPGAIDELPVLCVAAALAEGETTIRGAGELRVKESDRIGAIAQLAALGVAVRTTPDGIVVRGTAGRRLGAGRVDSGGDHRIVMAFAVAGLLSEGGVEISDPESARVSYPGFFERLAELGARVEES